jgi:hypothetical protein
LNGGLVTNLDPALLSEGQLSFIKNGSYRSGSQALRRAKGRAVFGVVTATGHDVDGLRDAKFDNGDHYLIAHSSANYSTAAVSGAGTFGLLASGVGDGDQLDVVHYRNRFYLFNGVTADVGDPASNRVFYLTATAANTPPTTRFHGMLPVIAAPAASSTAATFSQDVTGYYEYWTTEVAKYTQDGSELVVESTFGGGGVGTAAETGPTTVFVSTTAAAPVIFMPQLRNAATTHWRIYRSPKKEREADKKFPTGFMIAELAASGASATAAVIDTLATASASSFPASFNSVAPFADWASAGSAFSDNTVYASATVVGFLRKEQAFYTFNLGGLTGNVKGIQVEVQGYVSAGTGPVPMQVTIGTRDTVTGGFTTRGGLFLLPKTASKSGTITSTSSASPTTFTVGSSTDRWFAGNIPGLVSTDFGPNFMVMLSITKPGVSVGVDYLKVYVYYAATTDGVVPFPTVVYTFGDIAAQVGKNGPPPSANTADVFEDCLVCNDVSFPSLLRWSYPGDTEAFPATFFLDFETRDNDRIRHVKVVNNVLVVGLDNSIWRVKYLPSERDASFDRGKAMEAISRTFGIVNPMCACVYTPDDSATERLAFVSNKGIHSTDGFDFKDLVSLDWRQTISTTSTSTPIALINDPEESELLFYYRNDAASEGNETYKCLHLNYGGDHLQPDGTCKVSGPVHMRNFTTPNFASLESAWTVPRSSGAHSVFLGYGGTGAATAAGAGKVYLETGSTIPAEDPSFAFRTRRMYLADVGNEWELDELYNYFSSHTGTQGVQYTLLNLMTNATAEASVVQPTYSLSGQVMTYFQANTGQAEGLRIQCAITAGHDDLADEFLILEGKGFGQQDSKL